MKNLLILLLLAIGLHTNAQSISTNIRVNKSETEESLHFISYEITLDSNTLRFDSKNENEKLYPDFSLVLGDTIHTSTKGEYKAIVFDSEEELGITILYSLGEIKSICIHQKNGVDLFYLKSKITRKPQTVSYRT